ncbi:zinc ribbon domain-containing protein [Haloplasma contractile]|uniref:DZANK-type domain-containing protein n=1 Tax=Haloplasma contractile SSD-17B TaxID=1033810 RepID=F7PTV0_9MOLU|nr:hypothetical protein [Haloplasma contractile]ERJ12269.1 hypothetical protein HLPCO_001796 [Haloplasma contractile SSD-17B]
MYCRLCGEQINKNTETCHNCGFHPLTGCAYCQSFGSETDPYASKCENCNETLVNVPIKNNNNKSRKLKSNIFAYDYFLAFLIPVIGFMIYMMYKDDQDSDILRAATKVGFYTYIFLSLIFFVIALF